MSRAVEIIDVSKTFILRHNRANSLKSKFVGIFYKRYREQLELLWALKHIALTIEAGQAFGLIGKNGSGKSTLLRVIAGIYPPSSGEIRVARDSRMGAMIELGVGFHPELTGKENIYLGGSIHGLSRKEIDSIYPAVVAFSELDEFMDTPIKNYSSGMYARLGFALAVNLRPEILLVDEILSVGDEAFQRKCIERMGQFRAEGKTIIIVSHDPETVQSFCDQACVLDHGAQVFVGNPAEAIAEYHKLLGT